MNKFYTTAEVREKLQIPLASLYSYEKKGRLPSKADPHKLSRQRLYPKDAIDQLVLEKHRLEQLGRSVQDVAKAVGTSYAKVRKAIEDIGMDVKYDWMSPFSEKKRLYLTSQQEKLITSYLKAGHHIRPKRNHLYHQGFDIARFQLFHMNDSLQLRLHKHAELGIGFFLEHDQFVSMAEALRSYPLKPAYSIHREQNWTARGFTDIELQYGTAEFYPTLDALYSICGVENFWSELIDGQLRIAVRNGSYERTGLATEEARKAIQQAITSGALVETESHWQFERTERYVNIPLPKKDYSRFEAKAKEKGMSLPDHLQQLLLNQEE